MGLVLTVSRKGLMTLPSRIRRKYNIREGDQLELIDRDGVLMLVPRTSFSGLYGLGKADKADLLSVIHDLEEEHESEARA